MVWKKLILKKRNIQGFLLQAITFSVTDTCSLKDLTKIFITFFRRCCCIVRTLREEQPLRILQFITRTALYSVPKET